MRRLLPSLFVVALVAAILLPSIVEAQANPYRSRERYYEFLYRTRRVFPPSSGRAVGYPAGSGVYSPYAGGYRGAYGWLLDPATLQQMMSLPEGLASCQVDFSTGRVTSCKPIAKTAMAIRGFIEFPDGLLGTVHAEKGKLHFRPFDDTNFRVGTGMGGVLGAGGGAAIGAAVGNRRGAAVGGVAGAIVGGILGSRRSHNNCLVIEPETAREAGLTQASDTVSIETEPTPEPSTTVSEEREFSLLNDTAFYVDVFDGEKLLGRLNPGSSMKVGLPKSSFQGIALVPNVRGAISRDKVDIQPCDTGWAFIEPSGAR